MNYGKRIIKEEYRDKLKMEDVNPVDVYYKYFGVIPQTNKKYLSPFTQENTPSFNFYHSNGRFRFKCFSTGLEGDCIDFVAHMYGMDVKDAFDKIKRDIYNYENKNEYNKEDKAKITDIYNKHKDDLLKSKDKAEIKVILRDYNDADLAYWTQYGLYRNDLLHYDIRACKQVWVNDNKLWYSYRSDKDLCYRYLFNNSYKCYRPLVSNKKHKWISNTGIKDIQGLSLLPEKGELLIITKSYKDVCVLNTQLGLNAIALSSESVTITDKMSDYFHSRFDNVIMFYDNDKAGLINMERNSELTGIPYIHLPLSYLEEGIKDPSDLYKIKGVMEFKDEIKKLGI